MKTQTYRVAGDEVRINFPERDADLSGFWEFLDRSVRVIALDTETTGLGIFGKGFACRLVQFGDEREAWVLRVDQFRGHIIQALARPDLRFVAHNAPFDLLVLDRVGLAPLEMLGAKVFDTYILAHLCDPRTQSDGGAGLKLKELSTVYVDQDAADTQDGLNAVFLELYRAWSKTVSTEVLDAWKAKNPKRPHIPWGFTNIDIDHPLYVLYAGLDVVYTSRLLAELGILIKRAAQSSLAHFEHRVQLITTHQQRRGLRIDVPYTEGLVGDLTAEEERYLRTAAGYGVTSVNSPTQVVAALRGMGEEWAEKTDGGAPSVNGDVLRRFADLDKDWSRNERRDPNPLADAVIRAKRAGKWGTSYAQAFLDGRDQGDRIHPFIKSLAARTARMSISNPPLQQLPASDWTIRRAVIADPGHIIVAADYAQVEMRVLAALADVKEMKAAIALDQSIHEYTAGLLWPGGYEKWQYKIAKNTGFAKVYGGGARTIAKTSGSTQAEVAPVIAAYDAAFPEIKAYGRRLQRQASYGGGEVVTPSGRHLPLDRDRAYAATNYMVQSFSRDLLARALCAIDDAGLSSHVLLPVHDELVCQAPEEDAVDLIREIGRLMETVVEGVPIASDADVYGASWGHGYGCKVSAGDTCKVTDPHPHKWGVAH